MPDSSIKKWFSRAKGMSEPSADFQYQPLDVSKREVRFIVIECGGSDKDLNGPVRCMMYHTPLGEAGDFVALSYAWGAPTRTKPILLNEVEFQVTLNLEAFLQQRRAILADKPNAAIPLWIDALCIDQRNLDERASQVSMMGEIYGNAHTVWVWLGRREAYCERAYNLAEELGMLVQENYENNKEEITRWVRANTSPLFSTCNWMPFADLLNRSWWKRAWVVQEVVLARNVEISCGDYVLPYARFVNAASVVGAFFGTLIEACRTVGREVLTPEEAVMAHTRCERLLEGARNVMNNSATGMDRLLHPDKSFYGVLRRHHAAEASDPRDRIYAYLGLALESHYELDSLQVDYTLSPAVLYRNIAKRHLLCRQDLSILNDCSCIDMPDQYASWTPFRWRSRKLYGQFGDLNLLSNPPDLVFCAASSIEPGFDFTADDEILLLDCVLIDTVTDIGLVCDLLPDERINGLAYNPKNVVISWSKMLGLEKLNEIMEASVGRALTDDECDYINREGFYHNGQLKNDAWLRTVLCNPKADFQVEYVNTEHGMDADGFYNSHKYRVEGDSDVHLSARQTRCCVGKKLYVTANGYYGLGIPEVCTGDVVCIPLGSKTPFLLRPFGDCYRIVCETYVQGFMSGEIVTSLENGNATAEQIRLR